MPSSDDFGATVGTLRRCRRCEHAALEEPPGDEVFEGAYTDAQDPVSLDEEPGQVHTADRDLASLEPFIESPGRLLDIGCWTGSLLVAAARRGWAAEGIEPSKWAMERATERGCAVHHGTIDQVAIEPRAYRAVVACDVIEHLVDPLGFVVRLSGALEDGGLVVLTLPDAGSRLARLLGRRWWSVLPMHVQYFTRRSIGELLRRGGFEVLAVRTHPKAFSMGYYGDRLAAFVPVAGRAVAAAIRAVGQADRMVAPDLRDRMVVTARRSAAP